MSTASPAQNGSRIAIKFGGTSASGTKKPSARPLPPSTLGKRPRPHHALNDESESEEERRPHGRHERITAFGANGAESESHHRDRRAPKAAALTIERLPNRNWKSETKAQRGGGATAQQNGGHKDVEPADQDKPIRWGLTVKKTAAGSVAQKDDERGDGSEASDEETDDGEKNHHRPRDIEQEAVDALLGKESDRGKHRHLVIAGDSNLSAEDESFRRDFRDAPDESTLDEYEAMPIEEFGAALLRGMGWDGKERGHKVKHVKRRPNQLGLGAKELKGDEDLGAWNQKGNAKSRPRLHEYKREEDKRREKRDGRHPDSYKREREKEKEMESERTPHRHHERHHHR